MRDRFQRRSYSIWTAAALCVAGLGLNGCTEDQKASKAQHASAAKAAPAQADALPAPKPAAAPEARPMTASAVAPAAAPSAAPAAEVAAAANPGVPQPSSIERSPTAAAPKGESAVALADTRTDAATPAAGAAPAAEARASQAAASLAGWRQWRGPEQNGVSREKNLPEKWDPDTGENVLWVNKVGGMSSPIVMNNKIYTLTRAGEVEANGTLISGIETQESFVCADADTGKIIWQHLEPMTQTDVPFHRLGWSNAVGDPKSNRVYALGSQCTLQCLDSETGKVIWKRQMTEEFGMISTFGGRTPSPAVDDEQLYVGGVAFGWGDNARSQHRLFAFNKENGELNWTNTSGGIPVDAPYNTPVVSVIHGQKTVLLGNGDGTVAAYQARTGKKLWTHPVSQRGLNASVVVDGDLIYACSSEENPNSSVLGAVVCIDASGDKPKEVWRHEGIAAGFSSPTIHDGRIYAMENSGQMWALDAKTGETKWKKRVGTIGKASLVYADGKIYLPEANGRFFIIKVGDKKADILSKIDAEEKMGREYAFFGSVAIDSGRIFVQAANKMYCIGAKERHPSADPVPPAPQEAEGDDKVATVVVTPADVAAKAGTPVHLKATGYNAIGQAVPAAGAPQWSVAQLTFIPPPTAPRPAMDRPQGEGEKPAGAPAAQPASASQPPASAAPAAPAAPAVPPAPQKIGNLKGEVSADGVFTPVAGEPQGGGIEAKIGDVTGVARVRVFSPAPWKFDFEKAPVDKPPLTWLGAGGKFAVKEKDGNKVLTKLTTMDLYARARTNFGTEEMTDYTLQADVRVGGVMAGGKMNMPDVGVIDQRYVLVLLGNHQQFQIHEWPSALPDSFNQTIPFKWEPNTWYTLKLKVSHPSAEQALVEGKVWTKGEQEPSDWTLRVQDTYPQPSGAPGLYGNSLVTPIKSEIDYDNVMLTPNGK